MVDKADIAMVTAKGLEELPRRAAVAVAVRAAWRALPGATICRLKVCVTRRRLWPRVATLAWQKANGMPLLFRLRALTPVVHP